MKSTILFSHRLALLTPTEGDVDAGLGQFERECEDCRQEVGDGGSLCSILLLSRLSPPCLLWPTYTFTVAIA